MKRGYLAFASLLIGALLFTWGCSSSAPPTTGPAPAKEQQTSQQALTFRLQTAVPTASVYFELLKRYGERVDKMSGGRIKVEVLPDGAVVPAFEILDAVGKGVVEGGYAWTHYWSGKSAAALLFSAPPAGSGVGLDQLSHMAWLYEGGGNQLLQEMYDDVIKANVVAFMIQPMGPDPLGWFKQPISTVEEFKKLKYRSPPGIPGEVFKEMGITAVAVAGGEIVPSAERGLIDAAEWISPADDVNLGLQMIWKNYYLQGLHQATDVGEITINKDFWNKLTPDLQEIVRTAGMASIGETYTFNVARNAQALKELKEKHDVQVYDTPKEFYTEYVKATNKVMNKYAEQDAFFKKVWDSQKAFAEVSVPYWTKVLQLYTELGEVSGQ